MQIGGDARQRLVYLVFYFSTCKIFMQKLRLAIRDRRIFSIPMCCENGNIEYNR